MQSFLQWYCVNESCCGFTDGSGRIRLVARQEGNVLTLACGAIVTVPELSEKPIPSKYKDGRTLRPYQTDGIRFGEAARGRFCLFDEQRVGKTLQLMGLVDAHFPEMTPCVWVCKASLLLQFMREWHGLTGIYPQVIIEGTDKPIPGFGFYIVSYDVVSKVDWSILGRVKTVILDECQAIKNLDTKRYKSLLPLCMKADFVIPSSGSPAYNNAKEFYPALHLTRPELFHSQASFELNHVEFYRDGRVEKAGGIKHPARFKDLTKHFILRRERADVLPDLPTKDRNFTFFRLGDQIRKTYQRMLDDFSDAYDDMSKTGGAAYAAKYGTTIAFLSKMRHLTGVAKVGPTVNHVQEFMESTTRKIIVFVHHKDVANLLEHHLAEFKPLILSGGLDVASRDLVVTKFKEPQNRLLIASTRAGGEGLNLGFASDGVMVERQWTPFAEEQAEDRMVAMQDSINKINIWYPTISDSVDELFCKICERKRMLKPNLKGESSPVAWDQTSIMKELMQEVRAMNRTGTWRIA